jgi:hypothetical protein
MGLRTCAPIGVILFSMHIATAAREVDAFQAFTSPSKGNRTFRADWCAVSQKTKLRQALETVVCSEIKQVRKPLIHYGFLRVVVPICTKSTITPDRACAGARRG